MVKSGYPEFVARMLGDLANRVRQGFGARTTDTVFKVTGQPAKDFASWALAHATRWSH